VRSEDSEAATEQKDDERKLDEEAREGEAAPSTVEEHNSLEDDGVDNEQFVTA